VVLEDGRTFKAELYRDIFDEEVEKLITEYGEENIQNTKFDLAIKLFNQMVTNTEFEEFLTLSAYQYI